MNVLVLIVDALRQDYCCTDKADTPTIDKFREQSVTFENAFAGASWSPPSMSSIFSGIYPHRLGMYDFAASYPEGVQSLFETVGEAGYEVGSFVYNEDILFNNVPSANVIDSFRDYEKPKSWMSDRVDDDFFLFIHHFWVHSPYDIPDSGEEWMQENAKIHKKLRNNHSDTVKECREKYARAVERMSENWLDGILTHLEDLGISDETLVLLTGDHGESWGERYDDPNRITSNFQLHGEQLYDEHIHVPLIINEPTHGEGGKNIEKQVRHVDIFPTVCELLDLNPCEGWDRDGESLIPALRGEEIESRCAISSATGDEFRQIEKLSVRYPSEKLIWNIPSNTFEFYDLENDAAESTDARDNHPEIFKKLKDRAVREYERTAMEPRDIDQSAKETLEDLGYL